MVTLQRRREPVNRERVGFWFGLLLLFVPIFAVLLFFKPYSWTARLVWGGWLGFIVFVKLTGLVPPVINLTQIQQQVKQEQRTGVVPPRTAKSTFVQTKKNPPAPPPLDNYLRELGGGVLGRRIADHHVDGHTITIQFQETDWYLPTKQRVAEESIGAALSLFYGRDFQRVVLDFDFHGKPLRVDMTKAAFREFFGMSDAQIRASLTGEKAQETTPFRAKNMPKGLRTRFFKQFAKFG